MSSQPNPGSVRGLLRDGWSHHRIRVILAGLAGATAVLSGIIQIVSYIFPAVATFPQLWQHATDLVGRIAPWLGSALESDVTKYAMVTVLSATLGFAIWRVRKPLIETARRAPKSAKRVAEVAMAMGLIVLALVGLLSLLPHSPLPSTPAPPTTADECLVVWPSRSSCPTGTASVSPSAHLKPTGNGTSTVTPDSRLGATNTPGTNPSPTITPTATPPGGTPQPTSTPLSGALQWSFPTPTYITSSPTVAGGTVYEGTMGGHLYAVDQSTGANKWDFYVGNSAQQILSTPAVANGVVYFGCQDGYLYAVYAASGALDWKYLTAGHVMSSPSIMNGLVYFGSNDGRVYALDATSGQAKWVIAAPGFQVQTSPLVQNGIVYETGVGSASYVFALNASTGAQIWSWSTSAGVNPSGLALANGILYVGADDGNLYAIDASSGAEKWSYQTGKAVQSTPLVASGVVFFGSWDDNLYAVDAVTGTLRWRYTADNAIVSCPVIGGNTLYVASYNTIYAINLSTHAPIWTYPGGGSSPVLVNGVVYVGGVQSINALAA